MDTFVVIPGFENYEVNKLGQVRSIKSNTILKPILKQKSGYLFVNLYSQGRQHVMYIHRLVAQIFLNLPEGYVVNHKDLDKTNNNINNLEVVTQKENIKHSADNGRQVRYKSSMNPLHKQVEQYDLNGNLIKVWESVMDVERTIGIKSNYISNCALGKCKTSQGFIWKYKQNT